MSGPYSALWLGRLLIEHYTSLIKQLNGRTNDSFHVYMRGFQMHGLILVLVTCVCAGEFPADE